MKKTIILSTITFICLISYAYGSDNYRSVLVSDQKDFKQQIEQHKNIWDKSGQIITEKSLKQQELTQQMIALDNKIKKLQSEINELKTVQKNSTEMANDLRVKLSITEKHLKDYDSNFLKEK